VKRVNAAFSGGDIFADEKIFDDEEKIGE